MEQRNPTRTDAPQVTVVIATYNRSKALRYTLRTLIAQTYQNWTALIIGDCCSDGTAETVASLADERLTFINLPKRFGEQAGPNSVGMTLADTPYIALLNHDDLWFPFHLERAVAALEASGADMHWSRAAFFTNRGAWADRAFFFRKSPKGRRLEDFYTKPFLLAEPLSSWAMRRDAFERLGPMPLASESGDLPILRYVLHASQLGVRLDCGDDVTLLKERMHGDGLLYSLSFEFVETWTAAIEDQDLSEIMGQIENDIWLSDALGLMDRIEPPIHTAPPVFRNCIERQA